MVKKIISIVVSFNGGDKIAKTISALMEVTDFIVVIDNGSTSENLQIIENLCDDSVVMIKLNENKGIGYALNVGVNFAKKNGYDWVLTMDQDTIVSSSLVAAFKKYSEFNPSVMFMAPVVIDRNKQLRHSKNCLLDYAITSGNLLNIGIFSKIGLYNEQLFIDGVDFDFSLRARNAGIEIHEVNQAVIYHELGDEHGEVGCLSKFYSRHSPTRRYYIYRNLFFLLKNYSLTNPTFAIKTMLSHVLMFFAILIYEHDGNGRESRKLIWLGIKDYFSGRMGPINTEKKV